MSKALIIKNADFSANKITTITFDEEVPCTGVEFDDSAVSVSSLGDVSSIIGYTVTPMNTTDVIRITSSNSDVVHVGNNNALEVVGIGTCTLTLTCGTYSDTCVVTANITEAPTYIIAFSNISETSTTGEDYDGLRFAGGVRNRVACVGLVSDGQFPTAICYESEPFSPGAVTALKIPTNTAKIHVEMANGVYDSEENAIYFVSIDDGFVYNSRFHAAILSKVPLSSQSLNGTRTINQDVTVPSGATAYVATFRLSSAISDSIATEDALKEYAEETLGITIGYKAS